MTKTPNKLQDRRYAGQLDDFMKFDCQDCSGESGSAAVAELTLGGENRERLYGFH